MQRSWMMAGASLVTLCTATPALAAAGDVAVEEIVVTARKTEERAQDVPVSITAMSETRLRDLTLQNLSDVSRATPNLFVTRYAANPSTPLITIRGQSQIDVIVTVDPPVGVYVDGVYLTRMFGVDAALLDVERIEVLKGPQGTLYGKNTTGGAISIITKSPDLSEPGGYANVKVGDYSRLDLNAAVSLPIVRDKLGLRLVGSKTRHDGYGHDLAGREVGEEDNEFLRAKLRWEPNDDWRIVLSADKSHIRTPNGPAIRVSQVNSSPSTVAKTPANAAAFAEIAAELGLGNTPAGLLAARNVLSSYIYGGANGGGFYDGTTSSPQSDKVDGYGVALDVGVDLNDAVQARSITAYRQFRRTDKLDLSGSPFLLLLPVSASEDRNFSQELQLNGLWGERLKWLIGAYYNKEYGKESSITVSTPRINANNPSRTLGYAENDSWAAYGQLNYELTSKLRVTAGLRWTSETKGLVSLNTAGPSFACAVPVALRTDPAICRATFRKTFSDDSYLLSLDYKPTEMILLYAKTSRGFKGGGQNVRGSGTVESFAAFAPETVTDYELGVKSDLLDQRVRINAAAFTSNYRDVQRNIRILAANGATVALITNAARATIQGFELEVVARPTRRLTLNGSASVVDAKYKRFVDLTGDRSNEPFQFPKTTYSASVVYAAPAPGGELRLSADYSWRSKVALVGSAIFLSSVTQPAYGVLNARVGYRNEALDAEIAIFARNITKEKFWVSAQQFDNGLGYNNIFPGDPPTWGVELTKRFGGG